MKNMTKEEAKAILELKDGYKDEDIQIAFRKASKKYHPDLNDSKDAEQMMINIQLARNTLMHNLNFESIKQEQIKEIEKIINGPGFANRHHSVHDIGHHRYNGFSGAVPASNLFHWLLSMRFAVLR